MCVERYNKKQERSHTFLYIPILILAHHAAHTRNVTALTLISSKNLCKKVSTYQQDFPSHFKLQNGQASILQVLTRIRLSPIRSPASPQAMPIM